MTRRSWWLAGAVSWRWSPAAFGVGAAQADDFTVGGAFSDEQDVLLIDFVHPGGAFSAFTSQWPGADGIGVPLPPAADPPLDGFDAQLQLFLGTGSTAILQAEDLDGCESGPPECSQTVNGTLFTGGLRDSLLDFDMLAAGDYTLGLTVFDNFPLGTTLGDGYSNTGVTNDCPGPNLRVHLLGIDTLQRIQTPNPDLITIEPAVPVSISGPPFTS